GRIDELTDCGGAVAEPAEDQQATGSGERLQRLGDHLGGRRVQLRWSHLALRSMSHSFHRISSPIYMNRSACMLPFGSRAVARDRKARKQDSYDEYPDSL